MFDHNCTTLSSPIGNLSITTSNNQLIKITFNPEKTTHQNSTNSFITNIIKQLNQYFQDPMHQFNIAMDLHGTKFQTRVWTALQGIPIGETITYGQLAKQLNSHPRAIGQACRTNPIPIIIPCHRVVAAHNLGGFAGQTSGTLLHIKSQLLAHELLNHEHRKD